MSIHEIQIKGFRSLRNITWKPGRLNVVIGPNGSGKSNLLKALDLISKASGEGFVQAVDRMGGATSLAWDRSPDGIQWRVVTEEAHEPASELVYELAIDTIPFGESIVAESLMANSLAGNSWRLFERRRGSAMARDLSNDELVNVDQKIPEGRTLLSLIGGSFSSRFHDENIDAMFGVLRDCILYHDIRTDSSSPIRNAFVPGYNRIVDADWGNVQQVLHTLYSDDREFRHRFDQSMQAALGADFSGLDFAPSGDQRIRTRFRWKSLSNSHSTTEVSDGILRFTSLVTALLSSQFGFIVGIDEPETGLHPRMFPILAELARDAAEHTQVIFTTHSPEFLDAFSEFAPTVTVSTCEKGQTQFSIVDDRELQRWLKEYRLGELYRSNELQALA